MAHLRFRRRILRWGNAYGIRLTRAEMEHLRASAKTTVEVDVKTDGTRLDLSALRLVRLGGDTSVRHRELAEEAADAGS